MLKPGSAVMSKQLVLWCLLQGPVVWVLPSVRLRGSSIVRHPALLGEEQPEHTVGSGYKF